MRIIRPLADALGTLWLTATLIFFILRVLPGDPAAAELGLGGAPQAVIDQYRESLGLNDPTLYQYGRFIIGALRGDLGVSLRSGRPVTELIAEQFAYTVRLAIGAWLVAILLGVLLGLAASEPAQQWYVVLAAAFIQLALSTPAYGTATLAIFLFAVRLDWLPSSGTGSAEYLVLPVAVLGYHASGPIARLVATQTREALASAPILTARAKGLPRRLIARRHVLRLILPSLMGVMIVQAGFLFGGTAVTENIFLRPGIGRLMLEAVINRDFPLVQGIVLLIAAVYLMLQALSAWTIRLIDPRPSFDHGARRE